MPRIGFAALNPSYGLRVTAWNNRSGESRRGRKTVCDTRNAQDAACLFDRSGSSLFTSAESRRYAVQQEQDMERQQAQMFNRLPSITAFGFVAFFLMAKPIVGAAHGRRRMWDRP